MSDQTTNRALYLAIADIQGRWKDTGRRTLESYLMALWMLARPLRDHPELSIDEFIHLLTEALTAPAPPFHQAWRTLDDGSHEGTDYAGWEQLIIRQIRDLRDMEEAGTLNHPERWFGMDAPRGSRWYNYEVPDYLEGGVAGTYGGWEPEDGRRMMVPGPVAVLGEDGKITAVDPSEIERPVYRVPGVTWERFIDFLQCGQWYE